MWRRGPVCACPRVCWCRRIFTYIHTPPEMSRALRSTAYHTESGAPQEGRCSSFAEIDSRPITVAETRQMPTSSTTAKLVLADVSTPRPSPSPVSLVSFALWPTRARPTTQQSATCQTIPADTPGRRCWSAGSHRQASPPRSTRRRRRSRPTSHRPRSRGFRQTSTSQRSTSTTPRGQRARQARSTRCVRDPRR